jgi:hypothetical protein
MKKLTLLVCTLAALFTSSNAFSNEPVCHKCEIIREENKHKVNEFEFYEDYLKAHPEAAQNHQETNQPQETSPAQEESKG